MALVVPHRKTQMIQKRNVSLVSPQQRTGPCKLPKRPQDVEYAVQRLPRRFDQVQSLWILNYNLWDRKHGSSSFWDKL